MSKEKIYIHYYKDSKAVRHNIHSWCYSKKNHKRFMNERCRKVFHTKKVDDEEYRELFIDANRTKELSVFDYESSDGVYQILATDAEEAEVCRCKEVIENFLSSLKDSAIEFLDPEYADVVIQLCRFGDKNNNTKLNLLKVLMETNHMSFYGTDTDSKIYDFLLPF